MSILPGQTESSSERGKPASSAAICFHCGLAVPAGGLWRSAVLGEAREFCCGGCQAAAEAICAGGLEEYYRLRTANAPTVSSRGEIEYGLFDRQAVQESFVRGVGRFREASLLLEGIRCPGCLWLNEQRLRTLPGVIQASVAYASQSARVRWDPSRVELSGILSAIREIGYEARPFDPSHRIAVEPEAARRDTARLVFAGIVGMMVMNLAFAAYLLGGPDASGGLPLWETFARWCELVGAAILLAYPGQDFFVGAWRDLRRRRAGMDTPIVLGLAAAWGGSALATLRGTGPVYFDAIAMLVFLVLFARAFETRARLSAATALDRLAVVALATARRIGADGRESRIAALDLSPGDIIRMRPGEIVPADGVLLEGESSFDEAILTGEPWPLRRRPGERVVAGSCNRDQPVLLRVDRVGEASTLAEIRRLLERGLASRPPFAELADRLALRLVVVVLLLSAATAFFWASRDPALALPATVAVLIVTCPCALALATPIALAVAAGRLAKIGVLPARMAGMEGLASADTAAFDKTGTLTLPAPRLESVHPIGGLDRATALALAAALEAASDHPVALAIGAAAGGSAATAKDLLHHPGQGISGMVAGVRWWIGSPAFTLGPAGMPRALQAPLQMLREQGRLAVVLTDRKGRTAVFGFAEELRPGAREIVADLRRTGIRHTALLSGDVRERVERLGESLGFDETVGEMTVSAKLEWLRSKERSGERVLFIGDGLNDTPTLAAASTSVSFGQAPQLSLLASDFVILGGSLAPLAAARRIARRSRRLLEQNVVWALAYNLLSVPLAASGLVPPWAAALGMSASSLIVVANAMRLARPAAGERLSEESEARL
jgi:P-type Cu2+ transporter